MGKEGRKRGKYKERAKIGGAKNRRGKRKEDNKEPIKPIAF